MELTGRSGWFEVADSFADTPTTRVPMQPLSSEQTRSPPADEASPGHPKFATPSCGSRLQRLLWTGKSARNIEKDPEHRKRGVHRLPGQDCQDR